MKKIYTSIDLGTYSIKVVVMEYYDNKFYTLASREVLSEGIKKGLVVDSDKVVLKVKNIISEISLSLGVTIKKVIVNIPDYNARYVRVSNSVLFNEEHKVTSSDVNKLIKDSVYNKIDEGYELVTMLPICYKLDENEFVNPVGKNCRNMEIDGIVISTPKKNIYSVLKVIENASLEVVDIIVNGVANFYEVCNDKICKKDGVIVDLGHSTTNVSIFEQGTLVANETLQIGGVNIDKDLAYVFGISLEDARELKENFASAHKRFCKLNEIYEVKKISSEVVKLNQLEVSEVVMSRLVEILSIVKKQIRFLTKNEINYIILSGGLSEIKSFKNVASELFGKDVIIHNVNVIGCRNNKYTCSLGMVKYFGNKMETRGKNVSMLDIDDEIILTTPNSKNKKESIIFDKYFGDFMINKEEG